MNKKVALIFVIVFLLFGCSKKQSTESENDPIAKYNGSALKIAVVGDKKFPKISKVTFIKKELKDLVTNNEESFDAIIITKDAFKEADKDEYVSFFNSGRYPVFFYGTEDLRAFAFTNKNLTMKMEKRKNPPYVQGYINKDNKKTYWNLSLPENPTSSDKNKKMLYRISQIVDNTMKGKKIP
jgi:hypothetical protein